MENSFWNAVGKTFKINSIEAKTLLEAATVAYSSNEYCVYCSCWFIDVKAKFRIFRFKGTAYLVNEANNKKADLEIENSQKAHDKLDGKIVGGKTIKIVVPKKISLFPDNQRYFLVSEYLGSDMNENVYTGAKPLMSLNDCLSIIRLMLENGISHRGYLPRNIVENENTIFLFDWEDAVFSSSPSFGEFDHLWQTNFLLNWSYLFRHNDLIKGLKSIVGIQKPLVEPQLVKYENTFNEIINDSIAVSELRNKIDRIVFGSESPLLEPNNSFYLRPNDMGHLVADIFPSDIDVLHDILSYLVRKRDERLFMLNIEIMTRLIISYYKIILVENNTVVFPLQYYALIPILIMVDEGVSKADYQDILSVDTLSEIIKKISYVSKKDSIIRYFLSNAQDDLSKLLDKKLRERIVEAYTTGKRERLRTDKIISFILNESSLLNNQV